MLCRVCTEMIVDTIRQDPRAIAVHHKRNSTSSVFFFLSFPQFFSHFVSHNETSALLMSYTRRNRPPHVKRHLEKPFFFLFCTLGTNVEGVSLWKSTSPVSTSREFSLGQQPKLTGVQVAYDERDLAAFESD